MFLDYSLISSLARMWNVFFYGQDLSASCEHLIGNGYYHVITVNPEYDTVTLYESRMSIVEANEKEKEYSLFYSDMLLRARLPFAVSQIVVDAYIAECSLVN